MSKYFVVKSAAVIAMLSEQYVSSAILRALILSDIKSHRKASFLD